jgi:vacuolar protein sorting-associated protein 13A/C
MKLSSRERLDLNLNTTFAELAVTAMQMWSTEGNRVLEKPRGSYAPYKIENHTGMSISLSSGSSTDRGILVIAEDQATDWRFDDWKAMREVTSCQVKITDS